MASVRKGRSVLFIVLEYNKAPLARATPLTCSILMRHVYLHSKPAAHVGPQQLLLRPQLCVARRRRGSGLERLQGVVRPPVEPRPAAQPRERGLDLAEHLWGEEGEGEGGCGCGEGSPTPPRSHRVHPLRSSMTRVNDKSTQTRLVGCSLTNMQG